MPLNTVSLETKKVNEYTESLSHFTFVIYELKIQMYVFFITRYIKLSKDSLRTHGSHATVPHGLSQLFL